MNKGIIEKKIECYYNVITNITEMLTNDIHILDREGLITSEEIKKFDELISASGYFSEYLEDKEKRSGFKNNVDILKIIHKYLSINKN